MLKVQKRVELWNISWQILAPSKKLILIYATCHVRLGATCYAMKDAEVLAKRLRLVTCLSQKRELTKRPDTTEVRPCSDGLPSRSAIRQIYVTVQSASHRWRPIRTGPKR